MVSNCLCIIICICLFFLVHTRSNYMGKPWFPIRQDPVMQSGSQVEINSSTVPFWIYG